MSTRTTLAAAAVAALLAPAAAHADGLPVPVDDAGPNGIVSADHKVRWVTRDEKGRTVVEKRDVSTGVVMRTTRLHGHFTIPVVALDGTPAGLSHDAGTLVLIKPRATFPRRHTTLAILDTATLRTRPFTLRGDFSFDAVSPDGTAVYLIHYLDRRDPTQYEVRALVSATTHLQPKPIVDPHERGDEMYGLPATRVVSADGRWHYTLYDGAGGKPFVHALDTVDRRARCIDLPLDAHGNDVYTMRLRIQDGTLHLATGKGRPLLDIDTASFEVTKAVAPKAAASPTDGSSDDGVPSPAWIALVGLLLASAGAALIVIRRRQLARR